jgi:hypothetical protein
LRDRGNTQPSIVQCDVSAPGLLTLERERDASHHPRATPCKNLTTIPSRNLTDLLNGTVYEHVDTAE